jgi:signal transduction histidine kinase
MSTWRTLGIVAAVALVGGVATLVAGAVTGMQGDEILHLVGALVPAAAVTVAAAAAAGPLLARASLRQRFVAIGVLAAVVTMANLVVLAMQMFVSDHDASLVLVLLLYAVGAGVAAALVVARRSDAAVRALERTARRLGRGDLDARVGAIEGGAELEVLGGSLDEMAERLQLAHRREAEAERMRRDLITTISHDLRTPLASLRAMVEAIDERVVEDAPSLRRYAVEMRRSVHQLGSMVDDLFELTQLDAGAIEAETSRARLDDVVTSALAAVELTAREKGLRLVPELGAAADASCSPRVERVLQNLLTNAVRHTPADGTVRIEAHRAEGRLRVAVQDSGEGIASEDLARVFDPFFRADRARSGPGAGLGLALAKRIVEALGGRIVAESPSEAGARFAFDLPA